jgi:hypothetical protein
VEVFDNAALVGVLPFAVPEVAFCNIIIVFINAIDVAISRATTGVAE